MKTPRTPQETINLRKKEQEQSEEFWREYENSPDYLKAVKESKAYQRLQRDDYKEDRNYHLVGKVVVWTAKGLILGFILLLLLLGMQNLVGKAKKFIYRDSLNGIETFEQTCELANHTQGGCKALGESMDDSIEWSCKPSEDKQKTICEIKLKEEQK